MKLWAWLSFNAMAFVSACDDAKRTSPSVDSDSAVLIEGKVRSLLLPEISHPVLQVKAGSGHESLRNIVVAPDGSFVFRAPSRPFQLVSQLDNHVVLRRELRPSPGGGYWIELVHPPSVNVAGLVVDASGFPVEHARVSAIANDLLTQNEQDPLPVLTDSTGAFTLQNVPPGTIEICATKRVDPDDQRVGCSTHPVSLTKASPEVELRLSPSPPWWNRKTSKAQLTPQASWGRRIRVLNQDNKPEASLQALVWTYDEGVAPRQRGMNPLNLDVDRDGFFWLPEATKSRIMVSIHRNGMRSRWAFSQYAGDPLAPWELSPTASTRLLRVEACDGYIVGTVTNQVSSQTLVSLSDYNEISSSVIAWTLSDKDGSFEFEDVCLEQYQVHALDLQTLDSGWSGPVQSGNEVQLELHQLRRISSTFARETRNGPHVTNAPAKSDAGNANDLALREEPHQPAPWVRLRLAQGTGLGAGDSLGVSHAREGARVCVELWNGAYYAQFSRVVEASNDWKEAPQHLGSVSGRIGGIGHQDDLLAVLVSAHVTGLEHAEHCGLSETLTYEVGSDGAFSFQHLPGGEYQLSVLHNGRIRLLEPTAPWGPIGAHAALALRVKAGETRHLQDLRMRDVSQ